jgi:hypothetical protein
LPPGHDPSIPEMSNSDSPPAEPGVYLKEIIYGALRIRIYLILKKIYPFKNLVSFGEKRKVTALLF